MTATTESDSMQCPTCGHAANVRILEGKCVPVGCNDSAVRWLRTEADKLDEEREHAQKFGQRTTANERYCAAIELRRCADELERGADSVPVESS